ncbi:hypothetical protein A9K97_gp239 [Tokyovirus A1]|uniref:hypothetical protein n=1 Tax=Tokyovirus A1 TaxID=1826170 RepID=UPI0007A9801A|nr:hypothetical protein A9K97_gp239 [Tokyovirus A1]BAU80112.1 conserved hypothetical protein [Tokyovirus A1]
MFWKWSSVLTNKGNVDMRDLDKRIHKIILDGGKEAEFSMVREFCFEPYYVVFENRGKAFFSYVTRFTRFFLEGGREVFALELKEGDFIQGKDGPILVKKREKLQSEVEVFKVLLKEDFAFFVDSVRVKKS